MEQDQAGNEWEAEREYSKRTDALARAVEREHGVVPGHST